MDIIEQNELYKRKLLEVFYKFSRFIKEEKYAYWASDGTCLGAVRHGNIIPWDDDIDLLMPFSDFKRLLKDEAKLNKLGLSIISSYNSHMALTFLKIVDTNTTVWEQPSYPLTNVWIDVFPVYQYDSKDLINQIDCTFRTHFSKFQRAALLYSPWRIISPLAKFDIIAAYKRFVDVFYYRRRYDEFKNRFLNYWSTLRESEGQYMVCHYGNDTYIFDKEWFNDALEIPFANMTINVPSGYHNYLTYLFGDYMQLPPVDKRVPHSKCYVNLSKSVSMEVVKQCLRRGIRFEQ